MIPFGKKLNKEDVLEIEEKILSFQPVLKTTTEIIHRKLTGDIHYLTISKGNRSCLLKESGYYIFKVEGTILFSTYGQLKVQVQLIKYWLVDKLMPSQLKAEYSNLYFGELANYYERGELIKGEFILSWRNKESFYLNGPMKFSDSKKEKIKMFFQNLFNKKYDERTRAGLSMRAFVLTRARRHGVGASDRPFISFFFFDDEEGMLITERSKTLTKFKAPIVFDSRIEKMIDRLITNEIK